MAAVLVTTARLFNGNADVEVWEVTIPLDVVWAFFICATAAHVFTGLFLAKLVRDFQKSEESTQEKLQTYHDVLAESGAYVSVTVRRLPVEGKRLTPMYASDPSTWLSYGGVILLVVATLPWWIDDGLKWPGWTESAAVGLLALVLAVVNWRIGTAWARAISVLGIPDADYPEFNPFALDPDDMGSGGWFGYPSGSGVALGLVVTAVLGLVIFLVAR
jgi:hypothetical protein